MTVLVSKPEGNLQRVVEELNRVSESKFEYRYVENRSIDIQLAGLHDWQRNKQEKMEEDRYKQYVQSRPTTEKSKGE